jgi:protein ImuB
MDNLNQTQDHCRVACLLLTRIPAQGFDIQVFAEACYRFTPKITVRAQEGIFLDITGCQKLFSERGLLFRVQALARRFSLEVQIGFAEDAPTALAMARYQHFIGYNLDKYHLPLEALLDYASPFAPSSKDVELTKKVFKIIEVNKKLGLKNVGDFLSLPIFSLASRFGKEGVEIRARISGKLEVGWPGFQIPELLIENEDVEETVGLEPLLFVLKKLVDRSMARLRGLGKRASRIHLEFKLEPWSILKKPNRTWQISFPLSQGSTLGVMQILQERLNFDLARDPLQAPVQKISFQISETVPGRSAQRDFFDSKEDDLEKWSALVSRLACKLGKERVFFALPLDRYLPEKSWTKAIDVSLTASVPLTFTNQDRPARMLKTPELLRLSGSYVVQGNGKRWRTIRWNGPERLSGEWWKDVGMQGFDRDYYQVMTEKGEELWIYLDRQSHPPSFYLHGYFD